ncbi:prohibitin family protein [Candidatus Dojkabacteria bacterium]|nr:prohibitin family protein [Candidatus Dojkabacteria bacterium]
MHIILINSSPMQKNFLSLLGGFGILLLVIGLVVVFRSLVIVDAGEVGVVSTFGNVQSTPLRSGLQVKNPFSEVKMMQIRTQEYTMSGTASEGEVVGDDSIKALASDGASVWLDVTVFYHLKAEESPMVYEELGLDYNKKIIRPEIRSAIREVVAGYTVNEVYSTKREEVQAKILENLKISLEKRGIEVEDVLLRNVTLSQQLFDAIEQKLTAQQEAQRKEFEIEAEQKEAERKLIEAQGQKNAQGEINKTLSSNYLYYLYIKTLENHEGTIYVPTEGGLPLFKNVE